MPLPYRRALGYLFERFPSFTQTFCFREVRELGREGFEPAIFSIRTPGDEPPQDYPPEFSRHVGYLPDDETLTATVKRLHSEKKIPRAMRHTLRDWPWKIDKHRVYAAAHLGPLLRRAGIRHVHVHFAGIAARTAFWLKRFYGIGYSFTGHANDIFCEEPDQPVTLADLVREATLVVTVSDFSAGALRARFPDCAAKIHRVYNGIDLGQWTGPESAARKPEIVSVGRYIEKKGFPDLISACARLRDMGIPFQCLLVGEGPMQKELERQIGEMRLQAHVSLTGPRSQQEIRSLLSTATVFALPCVRERDGGMDNLPTVIMEAMACGIPAVSTRLAGVPEMIVEGATGRLVDEHDVAALAAAMKDYLASPELAQSHGQAARARAEDIFAIEKTTRSLKHLLVQHGRIRPTLAAFRNDPALLRAWLRRMLPIPSPVASAL